MKIVRGKRMYQISNNQRYIRLQSAVRHKPDEPNRVI